MPPKRDEAVNERLVTEVWGKIERALTDVNAIVSGEKDAMSTGSLSTKMNWYSHIYNAATKDQKMSEILYKKLRAWIESDLESRVTRRAKAVSKDGDSDTLFKYIAKAYDDFKVAKTFGRLTFSYLDQYLTKKSGYHGIEKLYLQSFHRAVYDSVKIDLMQVILRQVSSRREGNQVDMAALKSAIDIFTQVGTAVAQSVQESETIYHTDCEQHYLAALSKAYESRASAELSREGGHYSYLQWVQSRYDLEKGLANELLHPKSFDKVMDSLDRQCLRNQMKTVIMHQDSGFAVLLEDWKEAELTRMYQLFKRIPEKEAIKMMGKELKERVKVEGLALMKNFCDADGSEGHLAVDKPLVETCLALHDKYKTLISAHFDNEIEMQESMKQAFETFLNGKLKRKEQRPGSTEVHEKDTSYPEVLASYMDAVLRRDLKDIIDPDAELERIDKLVTLFNYLKEKDIFQEYSKAKLAKRLLQTTPNEDIERAFLEKLQRAMGSGFTHKMEGMLHDRDNTKAIGDNFLADAQGRSLPCEFNCQVLTAGHWPAYKSDGLEPPGSLRHCMNSFSLFYKKKYATRTLNWIHMLGSSLLHVSFNKGGKDVTCSTYQAAILSIVDEQGQATAKQIAENMKLDLGKLVKPNIASMYISKSFPILVTVDGEGKAKAASKSIAETDLFKFNETFHFKMRKFKLPAPHAVASQSGMPDAADIDARRKAQIDATIVRIMKARRVLHYSELLDAAITQLSKLFTPQPKHIKVRIEDLINRQYLKRDPEDTTKFEYLA